MKWENENGIEFDPDTGEIKNIVVYRFPHDGAVFSRRCGLCGRMVRPDDHAMVNGDGISRANGTCARCGPVKLNFVCWESEGR